MFSARNFPGAKQQAYRFYPGRVRLGRFGCWAGLAVFCCAISGLEPGHGQTTIIAITKVTCW